MTFAKAAARILQLAVNALDEGVGNGAVGWLSQLDGHVWLGVPYGLGCVGRGVSQCPWQREEEGT